jgi:hypothetical protein
MKRAKQRARKPIPVYHRPGYRLRAIRGGPSPKMALLPPRCIAIAYSDGTTEIIRLPE